MIAALPDCPSCGNGYSRVALEVRAGEFGDGRPDRRRVIRRCDTCGHDWEAVVGS